MKRVVIGLMVVLVSALLFGAAFADSDGDHGVRPRSEYQYMQAVTGRTVVDASMAITGPDLFEWKAATAEAFAAIDALHKDPGARAKAKAEYLKTHPQPYQTTSNFGGGGLGFGTSESIQKP